MTTHQVSTVRIDCDFCDASHYDSRRNVPDARECAAYDGWGTIPGRTRNGAVSYARPLDVCPEHAKGREAEIYALAQMQGAASRINALRREIRDAAPTLPPTSADRSVLTGGAA